MRLKLTFMEKEEKHYWTDTERKSKHSSNDELFFEIINDLINQDHHIDTVIRQITLIS